MNHIIFESAQFLSESELDILSKGGEGTLDVFISQLKRLRENHTEHQINIIKTFAMKLARTKSRSENPSNVYYSENKKLWVFQMDLNGKRYRKSSKHKNVVLDFRTALFKTLKVK